MFNKFRSQAKSQTIRAEEPTDAPTIPEKKLSISSTLEWARRKSSSSVTTRGDTDIRIGHKNDAELPSTQPGESLGLQLVHQPPLSPPVDIIFVHGLGGHSRNTWSYQHNPEYFWPGLWLPRDLVIGKARIFTFGYDAKILGPKKITTILEFAKTLLFDMRAATDVDGQSFRIGRVPIILVAHSMGGLVVKEAYLAAQNDSNYKDLFQSISAMVFLATPHRGADLALDLDRILKYVLSSRKSFVNDLQKTSSNLQKLNDQFRLVANNLSIVSFYEDRDTGITDRLSLRIVPRESAVLGYEKEESRPLFADHHNICKFMHENDANYVAVRNALRGMVRNFSVKYAEEAKRHALAAAAGVKTALCVTEDPSVTRFFFDHRRMDGSCEWMLEEPEYQSWLADRKSHVLWFHGPPATGKSIVASYVIKNLLENGHPCLYHFFTFGDQWKRSLGNMIRSIIYQAACSIPGVLELLSESPLADQGFEKCGYRYLWDKLFKPALFRKASDQAIFLVLDAIDESEAPKAAIELLKDLDLSEVPIKVFMTSRRTDAILSAHHKLHPTIQTGVIDGDAATHTSFDIRRFVEVEIQSIGTTPSAREQLKTEVLGRAKGNFLWVSLVIEDLRNCQTEEEIFEVLNSVPSGISELYQSMEAAILGKASKSNIALTRTILRWVICSPHALTVRELAHAAANGHGTILDLRRTLRDHCGQFLTIDGSDHVVAVHQTAKEYFMSHSGTELAIHAEAAHEEILLEYLASLRKPILGPDTEQDIEELSHQFPFNVQSATTWGYHLGFVHPLSNKVLDALEAFFSNDYVLRWIHLLALKRQLTLLVKCATAITKFAGSNRKLNMSRNPMLHRLSVLELLDGWAVDLVRIVGKFSGQVLTQPTSIYHIVPALCPTESAIHRRFGSVLRMNLRVLSASENWSDTFARISIPHGEPAWKIACAGPYVAASTQRGIVHVWSATDFRTICLIRHSEPVTEFCLNNPGTRLVSYGIETTKVWSIPTGQLILSTENPKKARAMSLRLLEGDQKVLVASDDRVVRSLSLSDTSPNWVPLNSRLLKEESQTDKRFVNTPSCLEIDPKGTMVAVSYRAFPLSVWSLDNAKLISRCRRTGSNHKVVQDRANWFAVDFFTWNPVTGHIIGVYKDKTLFKWHPFSGEGQEINAAVDAIASSRDGKLFVTSNSDGTVRVWNFSYFSVIYQLSSGDLVTGLSFNPEGTRFYDVRGSSITAWEPNGLLRLREADEAFSDTASDDQPRTPTSHFSEATAPQLYDMTALSAAPSGELCLIGNEDGDLTVIDVKTGSKAEASKFHNFLGISHIAWSSDSRILAAADLSADVQVLRIEEEPTHPTVPQSPRELSKPKLVLNGRAIHQLTLRQSPEELLVLTHGHAQIWDISGDVLRIEMDIKDTVEERQWLTHPYEADLLLAVGPHNIICYLWATLQPVHRFEVSKTTFTLGKQMTFNGTGKPTFQGVQPPRLLEAVSEYSTEAVYKCILGQDGRHLISYTKRTSADSRVHKQVLVFDFAELLSPKIQSFASPISSLDISEDVVGEVELILGVLPGSRIVYLDRDLWVCSTRIGSKSADKELVRHYFIPRDWSSVDSLDKCTLLPDGTILCPRDGDVAIIKSDLLKDPAVGDNRWHA